MKRLLHFGLVFGLTLWLSAEDISFFMEGRLNRFQKGSWEPYPVQRFKETKLFVLYYTSINLTYIRDSVQADTTLSPYQKKRRAEMRYLQDLRNIEMEYPTAKYNYAIIPILIDENLNAVTDFMEKQQLYWPTLLVTGSTLPHPFASYIENNSQLPYIALVDQHGKLVYREDNPNYVLGFLRSYLFEGKYPERTIKRQGPALTSLNSRIKLDTPYLNIRRKELDRILEAFPFEWTGRFKEIHINGGETPSRYDPDTKTLTLSNPRMVQDLIAILVPMYLKEQKGWEQEWKKLQAGEQNVLLTPAGVDPLQDVMTYLEWDILRPDEMRRITAKYPNASEKLLKAWSLLQ